MRTESLERLVIGSILHDNAEKYRDDALLLLRDGEVSYGEAEAMANRIAQGLLAIGVTRGEHVAVMMANGANFVHVVFALAKCGAVAVPVNTALRGELLGRILSQSNAATLVVDAEFVDELAPLADRLVGLERLVVDSERSLPPPVALAGRPLVPLSRLLDHGDEPPGIPVAFDDPQAIMYTSGTTGHAKGAVVPHALALTCALDSLDFLDRWGKTTYCPLPLFHAAGLWDGLLAALLSGGSVAVVERFSASRFWEDVRRFKAKVAMSVFSMIPILLEKSPSPEDKNHPLETFYMGKSLLDEALHERFGVRAVESYTSTEVGIATASPYGDWRLGSCGRANEARFEVAVVDERDVVLGPGEPGELVVRPKQPSVMTRGYYRAAEATLECFRNLWFHTGDRAWSDEDGFFYFLDRMSDSIRRRGENISAFDLECEVNLHPSVLECAAIGVPSELGEEEVKLAVVLRPGASLEPSELVEFCGERLPRFMVPRYVELVEELPRTSTDKVAKHVLRSEGEHGLTPTTWDGEAAAGAREPADVPGRQAATGGEPATGTG